MADDELSTQQIAGTVMAVQMLTGSLLASLARKGVLSMDEVREMFDGALLKLEEARGASPVLTEAVDYGRAYLDAQLRSLKGRQ